MPNRKEHVKDLYAEGLDLLIEGKRKAAFQNFKDIIEKDSENIKAYLRLGQVLREGGSAQQALKIHKSLLHRKKWKNFIIRVFWWAGVRKNNCYSYSKNYIKKIF